MNKYNLNSFKENGISFPFEVSNLINSNTESKYFDFQDKAEKVFGRQITLKPNLISKFFDSICFNEEIINNIKKLIGPNIYIWSSAIFAKAPGSGKVVSFHQDNPYWQLTTENVVTAWVALTNSNSESGALQIVPGSQKLGLLKKLDVEDARAAYVKGLKTTEVNDMLSYKQDLNDFLLKNKPITISLKPGEYSIHHVNTVHGSAQNQSKNYRIGFAIRYISSDTQHEKLTNDYALHVCGEKNSYFIDEKRPSGDFIKNEVDLYQASMNSGGAFGNKKY